MSMSVNDAFRCPHCGNRTKRILRCSICNADTGGEYLRSRYRRDGNVISVLLFCRECVDRARLEINLELSENDYASIIKHLMITEFHRLMEIADRLEADKPDNVTREIVAAPRQCKV